MLSGRWSVGQRTQGDETGCGGRFPPGLAWHLGKSIECGAAVAEPKIGGDCMLGYLRQDHFLVEYSDPRKIYTRTRVAAHTLYENASPDHLYEPAA
jgi:hypothetical protein